MEYISVLRQGSILKLWLGQVISAIGDRLFELAVVWLAVDQVGAQAGLFVVGGTVASLIFGLFGGVFADRWNRRTMMIATDIVRATVLTILVAIVAFGALQLWHLAIATTVLGALNALFQPALYGSLPTLAHDYRSLQAANGLIDMTWRLSNTMGPALASLLLGTVSVGVLFVADGLTFVLSAVAVFLIGGSYAWRAVPEDAAPQSPLADLRDGIRILRGHKVLLWSYAIMNMPGNILWAMTFVVGMPLYVTQVLGLPVVMTGWVMTAYSIGNVLGSLILGNMTVRWPIRVMYAGTILWSLGFLVLLVGQSFPATLLGAFIAAFGGPMEDVMQLLIIQRDLPKRAIGKVYSMGMVFAEFGLAAGMLLSTIYQVVPVAEGMAFFTMLQLTTGIYGFVRFGLKSEPINVNTAPLPN
jgi:MFS transporter, DHA3 family, macrolide efflux protein